MNVRTHFDRRAWLGLFFMAASTLAFEINLTRVFSFSQFYHLAFMIVSIALLGFGASGSTLAVFPRLGTAPVHSLLRRSAVGVGIAMVLSFLLVNRVPFDSFSVAWDPRQVAILALQYVALSAPFFFAGFALGALLHQFPTSAGRIYAANLFGSAAGCLLALGAPSVAGADGAVAIYAGLAAIAAALCVFGAPRVHIGVILGMAALVGFCLLDVSLRVVLGSSTGLLSLHISPYKGLSYALQTPGAQLLLSRWNAFSRVDLVRGSAMHAVPGLSYRYLEPIPAMDALFVDGDDISPVADPQKAVEFAANIPTAIAFLLRPGGNVLILGPRGGLDVLTALNLNSGPKTVVEENPLVTNAAPIYQDARLEVHAQSDRSFLRRTKITYDVIVLSLASSYHPVRSGAYALGEDYRYTVEAFEDALGRLNPDGVMLATRWLQDPPTEDLRLFALAAEALERGGGNPYTQLVSFRSFNTATVIIKQRPFTPDEMLGIRRRLAALAFDVSFGPGVRAEDTNRFSILQESAYYDAYRQLVATRPRSLFYEAYEFDVRPPTDDRPFFGHYFKWRQVPRVLAEFGRAWQPFGGAGYLVVVGLLVLAVLLAAVLIVIPVAIGRRGRQTGAAAFSWYDVFYFGSLGFGFLMVEIPLLQIFIRYLEQPAYAAALVIFSLLAFSAVGSRLSPRMPLRLSLAALTVCLLLAPSLLNEGIDSTIGLSLGLRMALTSFMLAPVAVLMGVPLPARIRLMGVQVDATGRERHAIEIPWAWAVNGATSVVASILAALLALGFGFSWVLRIGAAFYAVALLTEVSRRGRSRFQAR